MHWVSTFERCIDAVFMVHVLVNFRTAFIRDGGVLETGACPIAKRYLRSFFWFDVLASFPFDLCVPSGACTDNPTCAHSFCR